MAQTLGQRMMQITNGQQIAPNAPATTQQIPTLNQVGIDATIALLFAQYATRPVLTGNPNMLQVMDAQVLTAAQINSLYTPLNALQGVQNVMAITGACKIQFTYTVNGYGFSEIWAAAETPTNVTLATYVNARLAISGTNTQFMRCRISSLGNNFSVQYAFPATLSILNPFGTFAGLPPTGTNDPDTCLDVNCSAGGTGTTRNRRMFLRGIPDSVTQFGGAYTPVGGFAAALQTWFDTVTTPGWGWYGQVQNPVWLQISNMTNFGGNPLFTTSAAAFTYAAPPAIQPNVSVRIRNAPHPFSFLNGPLTVLPTSTTSATGLRVYPWPPSAAFVAGPAQIRQTSRLPTPPFFAITKMNVAGVGERKAGKPLGLHRGRQRNRVWS